MGDRAADTGELLADDGLYLRGVAFHDHFHDVCVQAGVVEGVRELGGGSIDASVLQDGDEESRVRRGRWGGRERGGGCVKGERDR